MRVALALSLIAVLGACAAKPAAADRLQASEWRIVRIDGSRPARPEQARLAFADDRLSATVGCNGMGGDWRVEQGRLIAGPFASTQMYCQGQVWDQERAIAALLVAAPMIEWDGDELSIRSSGHRAELARVSPPQPGS